MPSRRALTALLACLLLVGCADPKLEPTPTTHATPTAQTTPTCGGHTWPPVGPMSAPAGLAASHVSGLTVRLANGTASTWYFHVSRWVDDPCAGWTAVEPGTYGSIAASAALEASATGDVSKPPYFIGLEFWDHPCDASCRDVATGAIRVDVMFEAPSQTAASPAPSAPAASAPPGGVRVYQDTFAMAGTMLHPTLRPNAFLLPDGRVFVLGEDDPTSGEVTGSEVFDPTAGTFAAAGKFDVPNGATCVVLRDGRVLALGGISSYPSNEAVASAEIVDPQTGRFKQLSPMKAARERLIALRLPDGRVLVLGGQTETMAVTSAELFDPTTGSFTTVPMVTPRSPYGAVLLDDGRVLVLGGADATMSGTVNTPEIFDPTTSTFTETGPMVSPRAATATLLLDGRVLVWPGSNNREVVQQAELFDPKKGTFTAIGPMVTPRSQPDTVVLRDGRVVVLGGFALTTARLTNVTTAELFDPATETFSALPPMVLPRSGQREILLADGRVLIVGGFHEGPPYPVPPEIFDPTADAFGAAPPMAVSRSDDTDVLLGDGRVLVLGGIDESGRPAAIAELFQ